MAHNSPWNISNIKVWPFSETCYAIMVSSFSNAVLNSSHQSPSYHNNKVHLTPTTQNNKKLDTVVWLNVSATTQTYSNIYENHLEGITFALRQKVIELGHIVNGTTKLPTNSNLMVTCWRRKMMQYVHELKAVLQLSSLDLFNATLTFPFIRLL